jgi:uncharacterized protein (DUF1501 family)
MKRRSFLQAAGATLAYSVVNTMFPSLSFASSNPGNGTKVLFINLNGGLDGLYALQPSSGALYSTLQSMRPSLCKSPETLISCSPSYGLHPALTTLSALQNEGKLTGILGVGYKNMSRSHLDSETVIARGVPDRLTASSSGFLNRLGAQYGWSNLQAVSVTGTDLAFEGGQYRGAQVRGLSDFYFKSFGSTTEQLDLNGVGYSIAHDTTVEEVRSRQTSYAQNFVTAMDSTDAIKQAVSSASLPTPYPQTQFGRALRDINILFTSSNVNTQIGYMRTGGFDTHSTQATVLDRLLAEFNAALAVFVNNMKAAGQWDNLIVMVYSEFGRTNRENGSAGTDHGGANLVFLLGGAVNGSGVIGSIPTTHLTNYGWLPMQINLVEIYRRILMRMDLDPNAVFDTHDGQQLTGLFT